ncbi:TetR/AcrR family transcriptional regulator C-terminal domain-containing protein [Lacticaseibacillus daqingensis]|uniref:TetR/AcrR family transcriptional regulator C-terminal domain-containing protein n=1 Tax=Lacticaseibacillus daqingensis TaxID=2486014 RepID=UPI000F796C4F|nr:TetR/AcrR family transcriptional regulator C-terminal domain-containing protein [Lacticaseibacillus daqingensis]
MTTKDQLATALKQLMQTKAVDHITINEVADAAFVSRNTFYYHFADIHDLLAYIYNNEIIAQLDHYQNQAEWNAGLAVVLDYIEANRAFCLNTFRSLNRDLLNQFLYHQLFAMVAAVVDELAPHCSRDLRDEIANFYGWALVVQLIQWLTTDLAEAKNDFLARMYAMLHTTIAHVLTQNTTLDS